MSENKNKYYGAWVKTSKKGDKFINGKIEINGKTYYINIFTNTKKEKGSKQPDYNILVKEG